MPLAIEGLLRGPAAPVNDEFLKIRDLRRQARAEDGADFLRPSAVALGAVNELAAGAIGELNLRRDTVRKWKTAGRRPHGLRGNPHRRRVEEETEVVEEMARLAQHAP